MLTTKNTVITHITEVVPIQQHPLCLPQHSHKPPTCPLTEITPKHTGNYIFFLQVPFESCTVINLEGHTYTLSFNKNWHFFLWNHHQYWPVHEMTQAYSITQTQTHPESSSCTALHMHTQLFCFFVLSSTVQISTCGKIIQLHLLNRSHMYRCRYICRNTCMHTYMITQPCTHSEIQYDTTWKELLPIPLQSPLVWNVLHTGLWYVVTWHSLQQATAGTRINKISATKEYINVINSIKLIKTIIITITHNLKKKEEEKTVQTICCRNINLQSQL